MKRFCKVQISLNKYKGTPCSSVNDSEYTFEVEWSGDLDVYNNGSYTLTTYHNGSQCDIEFNGWSFAGVNRGGYHHPGSYSSVSICIECCDPKGECFKLKSYTRETDIFLTEGASLYMNEIMHVTLFKDKKEYEAVADIFTDYTKCKNSKEDLKSTLDKVQQLNKIIKRNETNTNIPQHFVAHAKMEYKRIVSFIRENVELDAILEAVFE